MIEIVTSYKQLETSTDHLAGPLIIGFFGDFSQSANQTLPAFKTFCEKHPQLPAYLVDVGRVKDVHGHFQVTQVPAVVLVKEKRVVSRVVGTATVASYESAFLNTNGSVNTKSTSFDAKKPAHSVTVYTTQSCPWCVRVKNYLRQMNVPFKEIDVGRDHAAAMELVRRTGQTGVPQLNIDGHYVIGFDKPKIDRLLGLSQTASMAN